MITYCTNIHPGESRDEIFLNLQTHLLPVKEAVSPDKPFPIGLRLSNRAALEIDKDVSNRLHEWCRECGCYIPTINGFPYGSFHSYPVKESVYTPDWRHEERVEYTRKLANLLDYWLPGGITGSISTVPVGFKKFVTTDDYGIVRKNLMHAIMHLDRLRQKSGKEIILSLEPEPGCVLETTKDVIRFIDLMNIPENLRNTLGVCFDCCHHAVEFENASQSLAMLSEAGVRIGKVQASSALRLKGFNPEILERFVEPCYLHQVVIKNQDGNLTRYNDLTEALRNHHGNAGEEWRIHFHVPVFVDTMELYGTTRFFLEEVIRLTDRNTLMEVETYTWDVLPPELQMKTITESIIREIQWVNALRDETNCRP